MPEICLGAEGEELSNLALEAARASPDLCAGGLSTTLGKGTEL